MSELSQTPPPEATTPPEEPIDISEPYVPLSRGSTNPRYSSIQDATNWRWKYHKKYGRVPVSSHREPNPKLPTPPSGDMGTDE